MIEVDPEKIKKLPMWAQDYIANLESERFVAVRALNEAMDELTPSPFYVDDGRPSNENTFRRARSPATFTASNWTSVFLPTTTNRASNFRGPQRCAAWRTWR